MRTHLLNRTRIVLRVGALATIALGASFSTTPANAQGNTNKPMANVLLLIDNSGSMERMPDNSLPSINRDPATGLTLPGGVLQNACLAGTETNPNRWGMLLQALTGNFNPYYSCEALDRTQNRFKNEYKINGVVPYDADYFLPYHRPLTGTTANLNVCAMGPYHLPGAAGGAGVGPSGYGYGPPGDVTDFPDDSLVTARQTYMTAQYTANTALSVPIPQADQCIFDQSYDGQLDAAKDYIRLALMTFDNAIEKDTGVTIPTGTTSLGFVASGGGAPFLGMWSYTRDASNPDFALNGAAPGAKGILPATPACVLDHEVGARHWGAPPWEGRMVRFPQPDASLFDVQRTNDEIQRVLLASRPYGATPIEGMMDDARDYFWYKPWGPGGPIASGGDPYVQTPGNCREQYIVLLTDGAPNLDLRPNCEQAGGSCPYSTKSAETALALWQALAPGKKKVTTFVIGFSVNGSGVFGPGQDGFPSPYDVAPLNTCKDFYAGASPGGGGTPNGMATACAGLTPPGGKPGSTAQACCQLNEIAYNGSGGLAGTQEGPFFAESQADIVLSFGKILASITRSVSTRTLPGFTPAAFSPASFGAVAATPPTTAQYVGSFIPNAQKPWSGELLRDRFQCGTGATCVGIQSPCPIQQPNTLAAGDSTAVNLTTQGAANRLFISVIGDEMPAPGFPPTNQMVDSQRTMRPFSTAADGIPVYQGTEWAAKDWTLKTTVAPVQDFRSALDIDKNTCKKSKVIKTGPSVGARGTTVVPALDLDDGTNCAAVMWGFETAHFGSISYSGTPASAGSYDFNIKCTGASAAQGRCSITATNCNVSNPIACSGGSEPTGQTCVPECAAFGAVFRASPTVMGPPDAFLRDSGFRTFQAQRRKRRPVVFAATTDGILHALKAIEEAPAAHHELWSFVPPSVLPRIASNYPSGNQILLDGTPVVADAVWERLPSDTDSSAGLTPGAKWHSTLVAGLGEGGGYYALNVTDVDCDALTDGGAITNECGDYQQPAKGNLADVSAGAAFDGGAKRGPHFLWQFTDIPQATPAATDPARVIRRARDGQNMVALFGRHTSTPAITTLQVKTGVGVEKQIGVAILAGGLDGPPEKMKNAPACTIGVDCCSRILTPINDDATPAGYPYRPTVRKWAKACSTNVNTTVANAAVPGRGVTIVRLDNGQILRHFGQRTDVPASIWAVGNSIITPTPFDSPIVGKPVVYPQITGAVAQKIFVGDADGAVWRIDVSNSDPLLWRASLFADMIPLGAGEAAASQPIQIPPVISLDPGGQVVLNVATGDQESIVLKTGELNYLWSLTDTKPTGPGLTRATFNWKLDLNDGERVTGPMVAFDRTLYFATFVPTIPSAVACTNSGQARLWGLDYRLPGAAGAGGLVRYCPKANLNADGICSLGALVPFEGLVDSSGNPTGAVIPGVALRASQPCTSQGVLTDEGSGTGFTAVTPSQFQLVYGIPSQKANGAGFPPSASVNTVNRPLPRISTRVDAWSFVTD